MAQDQGFAPMDDERAGDTGYAQDEEMDREDTGMNRQTTESGEEASS